ncbi:hypothetical protein EXIGLDRAFT_698814 [Exidia glandulosa HHB12029]|uniref:Uncharacterized protein n=1 Tax=Exidia glandulosa HHB12029 TaxID=1314781 RepID=A0A165MJ64_EXIGL|nr:hypothetical protein EXIGLDRAFT_698814 [Exidia glandulosa HHB12029]
MELAQLRATNTTLLTENEKLKVDFAAQAGEMAKLRQLAAHREDPATRDPCRSEMKSTDLEARSRWQDKVDELRAALDRSQSTNIALQAELDKRTRQNDSVAKLIADNLHLKKALAANQELSKKHVSEASAAREARGAMEQRVQEMESRVRSHVATKVILSEKLKLTEKRCAGLEKQLEGRSADTASVQPPSDAMTASPSKRKAPSDDTSSPRRQRQRTSSTLDSPEKVVDLTQDVIDLTLDDGDFYHTHNEPWDVANNQHFIAWLRHSVLEDAFTLAAATEQLRRTKWAKLDAGGVVTGAHLADRPHHWYPLALACHELAESTLWCTGVAAAHYSFNMRYGPVQKQ